jgi:hypothetical protein
MPKTNRKRRTREHVIADLSVNHVEKCVLQCGWTVQRFSPDYGLDLLMTTFNRRGEIENGDVRLQIKATESIKVVSGQSAIAVRLDSRDVVYWLNEPSPVILVVYDAKFDKAWWLYFQQALRQERRQAPLRATACTSRWPMSWTPRPSAGSADSAMRPSRATEVDP